MARGRKGKFLKKATDNGGAAGWEIVYSGFVLILLCFFIMLSSFASIEEARIAQFVKSFISSLSVLSGGLSFDRGERIVGNPRAIVDKEDPLAIIYRTLEESSRQLSFGDDVEFSIAENGLTLRLSNTVLFRIGEADISAAASPFLAKIADLIEKTEYTIRIEGHTDDIPIQSRKFPSNWELSTARAINVLRYFTEGQGLASDRFMAVGFGQYNPLVPNDSTENRGRNRRVEIVFMRDR